MGDTTDERLDLATQVSPLPPRREPDVPNQVGQLRLGRQFDILLTAGERLSMALLAKGMHNLGHDATSFTGGQAGVLTTWTHGKARIIDASPGPLRSAPAEGAMSRGT